MGIKEDIQLAKLHLPQNGTPGISWDDGGISAFNREWYARNRDDKGGYEVGIPEHQHHCLEVAMRVLGVLDPNEAQKILDEK
jgi:hypothetical protein